MGQRYSLLPSEIITRATTFDLVIMDSSMTLENHMQQSSKEGYIPDISTEELLKIKERA
jgi:hypothetical protein